MRRLDKGAPLRAAIRAAGLDIPHLAARTKELDPTGKGLSPAYVGFIVGSGKTAREETSDRAAGLIAQALDQEVDAFFETVFLTLNESTSTRVPRTEASRKSAPSDLPERLLDQRELAGFLRKSMSWIDRQIKDDPHWPGLIYVGRSRRFDPRAVLAAMRQHREQIPA